MINITTLSDKNYLIKGLSLYQSLIDTTKSDFTLYYLCLDDYTYDFLNKSNLPKIKPYSISYFNGEKDFENLKKNTKYISNGFCSFCFALAAFFTNYILKKIDNNIFYIDADIVFYENIETIIKLSDDKSVGIHLHKHVPIGHHVGGYNVGVVFFKKNDIGEKVLEWWKNCVIDSSHQWYSEYGRVGDQAYLEYFEILVGKENIFILDDEIGHAAPWNFKLLKHLGNRKITWDKKDQSIFFVHFSQFSPNFEENNYCIDREGGSIWGNQQLENPLVKEFYDDYFDRLKRTKNNFNL